MNNYTDILDAMQIYGDKLETVHVGWIDKDGIQIKDFVRLIFHNDLYVIFGRQMEEREETYKVDYSDIRSIHGMVIPSVKFEQDTCDEPIEFIARAVEIDIEGVAEMFKSYIKKFGYYANENSISPTLNLTTECDTWFVDLIPFFVNLKDYPKDMGRVAGNLGWFSISEKTNKTYPSVQRISQVKGKIRATLSFFNKLEEIPARDKKLMMEALSPLVVSLRNYNSSKTNKEKREKMVYEHPENGRELLLNLMFSKDKIFKSKVFRKPEYGDYVLYKLMGYNTKDATHMIDKRHQIGSEWNKKTRRGIDNCLTRCKISDYEKTELSKIRQCFA